ncbi:MAG: hypothetical protein U0T32_05585 [Chitinophagales bacterium]
MMKWNKYTIVYLVLILLYGVYFTFNTYNGKSLFSFGTTTSWSQSQNAYGSGFQHK